MTSVASIETIAGKIYASRGVRIMLDRDLALLYGVETRALKQAVRRNAKRFPRDFMFEFTEEKLRIWRSQFVISKGDRKGLRHRPMAFTEQGVAPCMTRIARQWSFPTSFIPAGTSRVGACGSAALASASKETLSKKRSCNCPR